LAKSKSTFSDKMKFILYVIIALITIGGSAFAIEKYFAKESQVQAAVADLKSSDASLSDRIELSIIDDQIFQQEQTIQRIEDWRRFEQRKEEPELTLIEKDTLKKAKKRLTDLEKRKEEKIKRYEDGNN